MVTKNVLCIAHYIYSASKLMGTVDPQLSDHQYMPVGCCKISILNSNIAPMTLVTINQ